MMNRPFAETNMTENILKTFGVEAVNSDIKTPELTDEQIDLAMRIYGMIAKVFIEEKVDIWTSLQVVTAMGDAIALYISTLPLQEAFPSGKD